MFHDASFTARRTISSHGFAAEGVHAHPVIPHDRWSVDGPGPAAGLGPGDQVRPPDRKASLRRSGAQASQASSIASRSGLLVAALSCTRTAAYPSKCGMVKKPRAPAGQHGLLVGQVGGAQRQDRARRRRGARRSACRSALENGRSQAKAFPADEPRPVAVALALGHLGQCGEHALDVAEGRHGRTLPVASPPMSAGPVAPSRDGRPWPRRRRTAPVARPAGAHVDRRRGARRWPRWWRAATTSTSRCSARGAVGDPASAADATPSSASRRCPSRSPPRAPCRWSTTASWRSATRSTSSCRSWPTAASCAASRAPLDDTVPAERPITIEDLLTFRLGFGVIMAPPGTYPIQEAEAELGL